MRSFELVNHSQIIVGTSYSRYSGHAKETEESTQIPLFTPETVFCNEKNIGSGGMRTWI